MVNVLPQLSMHVHTDNQRHDTASYRVRCVGHSHPHAQASPPDSTLLAWDFLSDLLGTVASVARWQRPFSRHVYQHVSRSGMKRRDKKIFLEFNMQKKNLTEDHLVGAENMI